MVRFEQERRMLTPIDLEIFTRPFYSAQQESQLLQEFAQDIGKHFERSLIVARLQPLHRGHIHLIKQALAISDRIVIGIGSTNKFDEDNPFSFEQRRQMLEEALIREGLQDRVEQIVGIEDIPDDNVWLQETLRKTGQVDAVIGNNDWVNGIFTQNNIPAIYTPLLERQIFEGRKIRALLRMQGKL